MLHRYIRYRKLVSREDSRKRIGTVVYEKDCYIYIQVYYTGEERDFVEGMEYANQFNSSYCEMDWPEISRN